MKYAHHSIKLFLFCLFSITINAQKLKIEDITKEDYLNDLKLAYDIISQQHPNPHKYVDQKTFQKSLENARKEINRSPDYVNFLKNMPRIKDGHLLYLEPTEFYKQMVETFNVFPYPVYVSSNRIFVNIKGGEIAFGSEILTINGAPVKEIIASISRQVHGDGNIKSATEVLLNQNFQNLYAMYLNHNPSHFDITYINPKSKERQSIRINPVDYHEGFRKKKLQITPVNRLEMMNNINYRFYKKFSTGVITVNSFALNESYAYKEFSEFFKRLNAEKYKNVIIDLRHNGGGSPKIAALLYSFIATKNFSTNFNYKAHKITFGNTEFIVDQSGAPYGKNDITNLENFLYQRFNKEGDFYVGNERLREGALGNFPKDKDVFDGKVYVIIGGGTFSAAVYFASLVKANNRGTLVGQETGGNANNTFAGYFVYYELPKTRLMVRIPITELFFDKKKSSDTGIVPDILLSAKETIPYLRKEKDPEINYLLERM